MKMFTASTCLTCTKFTQIKNTQLLFLFILLSALSIIMANSHNTTATKITASATANKIALSSAPTPPSTRTSKLSDTYSWGHNTKYSTVIFDENIIVKGFTLLDITYPTNDDLCNEYTIIGLYAYAIDELDSAIGNYDFSMYIIEGGVGSNSTTVRFESKTLNDVEFNLKIFGINV